MGLGARKFRVTLPEETAIDAEVDLCLEKGEYFLQARVKEVAQQIVEYAHQTCSYSKAIRNNVNVEINLV